MGGFFLCGGCGGWGGGEYLRMWPLLMGCGGLVVGIVEVEGGMRSRQWFNVWDSCYPRLFIHVEIRHG